MQDDTNTTPVPDLTPGYAAIEKSEHDRAKEKRIQEVQQYIERCSKAGILFLQANQLVYINEVPLVVASVGRNEIRLRKTPGVWLYDTENMKPGEMPTKDEIEAREAAIKAARKGVSNAQSKKD